MKTFKLLIRSSLLSGMLYLIGSCNAFNKGMSSSEYYNYLREDTVICEINTFSVEPTFESVLDTIIQAWHNCPACKNDPHPFVFEIEEILDADTLYYVIKTNASPKIAHHYYSGAFTYQEHVFAVVKKSSGKSIFVYNEGNEPTKIYFCNRIHSSKCGLLLKCQHFNESWSIASLECQEAEIIKIK